MYVPDQFRIEADAEMVALMRANPFATLVSTGVGGLVGSHLPTVVKEEGGRIVVEAHLARANGHWRELQAAAGEAMLIYTGPQGYVSPAWYPSKAETQKVVPTWNYAAVHAYGRAEVVDDKAFLLAQVEELTRLHEGARAEPWAVSDAPASFVEVMLRGIVGLRLAVTRLEGKLKMSQNRPRRDMEGVVAGLTERNGADDRQMAGVIARLARAKPDGA